MAQNVINNYEILLNSVRYRIEGGMHKQLLSRFPAKIITGEAEYANQNELSSWIISDQRGGIGVEEMDESVHADRCFFSDCLTDYKGHIRLPRSYGGLSITALPTLTDGGMEIWTDATNLTNWTKSVTLGSLDREATIIDSGTYSAKITSPNDADNANAVASISQALTGSIAGLLGKKFHFAARVVTSTASAYRVAIVTDGTGGTTTYSSWHTGGGAWETLTARLTIPADATSITVWCIGQSGAPGTQYIGYFDTSNVTSLSGGIFCNFNSALYLASGTSIYKLNAGGTGFDFIYSLPATITDMVSSLNSRMYIATGNDVYYWWMSTAEAFTQAATPAYWFLQWNGTLNKFLTTGTSFYSADPDGAPATWTTYGTVTDIPAAKLRKPVIYQDADGNDIMYWANSIILKAHVSATPKWIDTKVKLSDHPNGAKGCLFWQDGLFISQGLQVKKYIIGSTALITEVGLDRDDGLMAEYNGEIVKLVEGETEMFALVDALQTTGTSYPGIYAYDGKGWKCWYVNVTSERSMFDGIVSTAYGYRLYFSWGITGAAPSLYYIDLKRGLKNPSQLATVQEYVSTGIWISGWFNAGSSTETKCLKSIKTYCKGISTTETVVVKYRINKSNIDRDTGWTTLVTLDTTGENNVVETLLASGAGITFSSIQIRLELARGSTATATPDIQAVVLGYIKDTVPLWGWSFVVTAGEAFNSKSPKALEEALTTATESQTLIPLLYRGESTTETKYVRMQSFNGLQGTGREYAGKYAVSVIEP